MSLALEAHILYLDPKREALRNLFLASLFVSAALIGYPEATTEFSLSSLFCNQGSTGKLTLVLRVFDVGGATAKKGLSWAVVENVPLHIMPDRLDGFTVGLVF